MQIFQNFLVYISGGPLISNYGKNKESNKDMLSWGLGGEALGRYINYQDICRNPYVKFNTFSKMS